MTWHAVTYRIRTGHRRPWTWTCTCGRGEHARTEGQAYRRVIRHLEGSKP